MHSTIISETFIKQYDVFSRIRNTFLSPGKPNEQGRRDLLSELEILKSLPAHNHVIQLLACVTESGNAKICFFFVTRILHLSYNFVKFHWEDVNQTTISHRDQMPTDLIYSMSIHFTGWKFKSMRNKQSKQWHFHILAMFLWVTRCLKNLSYLGAEENRELTNNKDQYGKSIQLACKRLQHLANS